MDETLDIVGYIATSVGTLLLGVISYYVKSLVGSIDELKKEQHHTNILLTAINKDIGTLEKQQEIMNKATEELEKKVSLQEIRIVKLEMTA